MAIRPAVTITPQHGTSLAAPHNAAFMAEFNARASDINALSGNSTVYYVDPVNGADTNDGLTVSTAFASLQAGVDACEDGAGDFVVRLPGTENPTTAINFNCEGITVIASSYGCAPAEGAEAGFATYPDASYTSGPVGIISKPCSIIGLEFVTRNTVSGANDDGSDSGAALCFIGEGGGELGGFSLIQDCRFVDWWGNDYGIEFAAGSYNRVEGCTFEGFTSGILMRGTASNNPESIRVTKCWFKDCTNGIEHKNGACTAHNFLYDGNFFVDVTAAVNTNNQASDGLVAGNWYETAAGATYDVAVAAAQGNGINFAGNNYSE